jgi:hypothetical protein
MCAMQPLEGKIFVYGLLDPFSGELRYVGKTVRGVKRIKRHQSLGETLRGKTHKDRWALALIRQGRPPSHIVLKYCASDEEAQREEIRMIALFREYGISLTNLTDGGEGGPGYKWPSDDRRRLLPGPRKGCTVSEASRRLMSLAKKGHTATAETRRKLSEVRRGHVVTAETRQKISLAHKGRKCPPVSDETRKKMSDARMGYVVPVETLRRMSEARRGMKMPPTSDETRRKLSEAWTTEKRRAWSRLRTGQKHSLDTRAKMVAAQKRRREKEQSERSAHEQTSEAPQ